MILLLEGFGVGMYTLYTLNIRNWLPVIRSWRKIDIGTNYEFWIRRPMYAVLPP